MSLHIEPQENIIRENSHEDFCRVAVLRFDASAEKSFHVHMTNKLFMLLKLKLAVIQVQNVINYSTDENKMACTSCVRYSSQTILPSVICTTNNHLT